MTVSVLVSNQLPDKNQTMQDVGMRFVSAYGL